MKTIAIGLVVFCLLGAGDAGVLSADKSLYGWDDKNIPRIHVGPPKSISEGRNAAELLRGRLVEIDRQLCDATTKISELNKTARRLTEERSDIKKALKSLEGL